MTSVEAATASHSFDRRERVVKGLEGFSPYRRMENEASSVALVLDLDAEFVFEISAIPKQVNDDSAGFPVSKMVSRGQHSLAPPGAVRDRAT
jgi:hypothetical protein